MAITSMDTWWAASKQYLTWIKTASRTSVAGIPFTVFDLAGNPGAGTLNVGNTANGIVPTDATNGYPSIGSITNIGYLTGVNYGSSVACRITIYDRLFACGAYAYNVNTTLTSQPSFSSRVPNLDYRNLQVFIEAVTAFTGTPSFRIYYLDQDGNSGDTGTISAGAALILGRCFQMPLAAGDSGIRQINQVVGTVATAGTFNISVLRKLWTGRGSFAGDGDYHDFLKTGAPRVYSDSALYVLITPFSTASGLPELQIGISDG